MAGEESVPRPEFEMFCRATNGGIARIEKAQIEGSAATNEKLDQIIDMLGKRVTWEAFDRHRQENKEDHDSFKGRPSWATTITLTFLSSLSLGLLGALIGVLVR